MPVRHIAMELWSVCVSLDCHHPNLCGSCNFLCVLLQMPLVLRHTYTDATAVCVCKNCMCIVTCNWRHAYLHTVTYIAARCHLAVAPLPLLICFTAYVAFLHARKTAVALMAVTAVVLMAVPPSPPPWQMRFMHSYICRCLVAAPPDGSSGSSHLLDGARWFQTAIPSWLFKCNASKEVSGIAHDCLVMTDSRKTDRQP